VMSCAPGVRFGRTELSTESTHGFPANIEQTYANRQ
jgi:hypothetical protein